MADNTSNNQLTRTAADTEANKKYGFKIGRIVSHLDPHYMGGLKVTLINFNDSGNELEDEGETIDVKYAPMFYGTTPAEHLTSGNKYEDSQQSYGFWAVPPDVGTRVLVGFVDGDINRGYWFACVQDKYMNFMVPGGQPVTEFYEGKPPEGVKAKKLPTAEYNKKLTGDTNKDPTKNKKPLNLKFIEKLKESGLIEDDIRGTTSTSARREIPSGVYGISSPGPLDKNGPKAQRGTKDNKATVAKSRLGGQSFVIDDGDDKRLRKGSPKDTPYEYIDQETSNGGDKTIPHNEMIRLRTRAGHQILLHNSEDLIYIGNGRGTAWIELTSNGKIDVYAMDSISVHSENDINFVADRDINLEAGRNMNFNAVQSIFNTTGKTIETRVGEDIKMNAARDFEIYGVRNGLVTTGESLALNSYLETRITSLQDMHIYSEKNILTTALENINTTSTKNMKITVNENYDLLVTGTTKITSGGSSNINSGGGHFETAVPIHMNGPTAAKAQGADPAAVAPYVTVAALAAKFPARVPQHEPWNGHENWDPNAVTPEKTEAKPDSQDIHVPIGERIATDRALISGKWDSGEGSKYPEIPLRPK